MFLVQWGGWQLLGSRKLCLSVGFVNKSVLSDPSFKVTVVSRKWTLLCEKSAVNLMEGWNELICSMNEVSFSSPWVHIMKISSM